MAVYEAYLAIKNYPANTIAWAYTITFADGHQREEAGLRPLKSYGIYTETSLADVPITKIEVKVNSANRWYSKSADVNINVPGEYIFDYDTNTVKEPEYAFGYIPRKEVVIPVDPTSGWGGTDYSPVTPANGKLGLVVLIGVVVLLLGIAGGKRGKRRR